MRKLLLILAVMAAPALAANSFIQENHTTSALSGTTMSLAYSGNVTNGDWLVSTLRYGSPTGAVTSVTGTSSCNVTWTVIFGAGHPTNSFGSSGIGGPYAYAKAASTGACTVSWNLSGSDPGGVLCVAEWSGPASVGNASTPLVIGNVTTLTSSSIATNSGDLLIGIFNMQNGSATVTPNSGFTLRSSGTSGGTTFSALTDNLSAITTGSQAAAATIGAGVDGADAGILCIGTCTGVVASTGFPMVIKYRSTPRYRIPCDDRKRKLEIVRI